MFLAVLRRADEHLDQVVVQAVEELALEGPLELRIVEIARMHLEVIGVDRRISETGPDDYFDGLAFGARIELDQRMLVELELLLHAQEAVGSHSAIVADRSEERRVG